MKRLDPPDRRANRSSRARSERPPSPVPPGAAATEGYLAFLRYPGEKDRRGPVRPKSRGWNPGMTRTVIGRVVSTRSPFRQTQSRSGDRCACRTLPASCPFTSTRGLRARPECGDKGESGGPRPAIGFAGDTVRAGIRVVSSTATGCALNDRVHLAGSSTRRPPGRRRSRPSTAPPRISAIPDGDWRCNRPRRHRTDSLRRRCCSNRGG